MLRTPSSPSSATTGRPARWRTPGTAYEGCSSRKPARSPIKLITPLGTGPDQFGLHHLAFLTDDIEGSVAELAAHGARVLSSPQPGEMFDDEMIAFLFAGGVNVELVTTDEWRDRITDASE